MCICMCAGVLAFVCSSMPVSAHSLRPPRIWGSRKGVLVVHSFACHSRACSKGSNRSDVLRRQVSMQLPPSCSCHQAAAATKPAATAEIRLAHHAPACAAAAVPLHAYAPPHALAALAAGARRLGRCLGFKRLLFARLGGAAPLLSLVLSGAHVLCGECVP